MTGSKGSEFGQEPLTLEDLRRLRDIVLRRSPNLRPLLFKLGTSRLSTEEREALRGAVADEMAASGYLGSPESDRIGRELDDLIDRLGHL